MCRSAGTSPPGTSRDAAAATNNTGMARDTRVPIGRASGHFMPFIAAVDWRKAPASPVETPRLGTPPEHRPLDGLLAEKPSGHRAPPPATSAEWSSPPIEPRSVAGETFAWIGTLPAKHQPVALPLSREVAATATI